MSNIENVQSCDKSSDFTCGICDERYTMNKLAPKTLNCGHTFCSNCIEQIGKTEHIPCGACTFKTWTSPSKLIKNYQMLEVLDKYHQLGDDSLIDLKNIKDVSNDSKEAIIELNTNNDQNLNNDEAAAEGQANETDVEVISDSVNANLEETSPLNVDEDTEQVLLLIRESSVIITGGLDDLANIAKDVKEANHIMEFQNRVSRLFVDIDEIAYHPLISLVRRSVDLQGNDNYRLQDLVRNVDPNTIRVNRSANGDTGNANSAPIQVEIEANNATEEVREQYIHEINVEMDDNTSDESDHEHAENYSLDDNSENLTSIRGIGSTADSEMDNRDAMSLAGTFDENERMRNLDGNMTD